MSFCVILLTETQTQILKRKNTTELVTGNTPLQSSLWGFVLHSLWTTGAHTQMWCAYPSYPDISKHKQQFVENNSEELEAGVRLALIQLVVAPLGLINWPSRSQATCRWLLLINVTLGSVMISSHDTPCSPLLAFLSLSLNLSSHNFQFTCRNVSISAVFAGIPTGAYYCSSIIVPIALFHLSLSLSSPSHMLLYPCPLFTVLAFLPHRSHLCHWSLLGSPITRSLSSCPQSSILLV